MPVLPQLTPENTAYWTGGEHGKLMIVHCDSCDFAIHPPEVICPSCLSRAVTPRQSSGTGVIYSFTINHQPWMPDMVVPFPIVVVDIDGEPGVRVTGKMIGIEVDAVQIGQKVEVVFLNIEDVWIPQFRAIVATPA